MKSSCRPPGRRRVTYAILVSLGLLLIACGDAVGQSTPTLRELHDMAVSGNREDLRRQLPSLAALYSDDPGYLYLQGCAEEDGDKALRHYQTILNHHPKSEWADDALYRLYQYSYAVGAYKAADDHLNRLLLDYPSSPHAKRSRTAATGASTEAAPAYSVQVGAFSAAEDAEILAEKLRRVKYTVEVRIKRVGERTLHAVRVGRFNNRQDARNFASRLKSREKLDGMVVRYE